MAALLPALCSALAQSVSDYAVDYFAS